MTTITDLEAAAGNFDSTSDPVTFQADKHPVDYYLANDRSVRGDLLLNNHEVIVCRYQAFHPLQTDGERNGVCVGKPSF